MMLVFFIFQSFFYIVLGYNISCTLINNKFLRGQAHV